LFWWDLIKPVAGGGRAERRFGERVSGADFSDEKSYINLVHRGGWRNSVISL
jgi:hypothetical protein